MAMQSSNFKNFIVKLTYIESCGFMIEKLAPDYVVNILAEIADSLTDHDFFDNSFVDDHYIGEVGIYPETFLDDIPLQLGLFQMFLHGTSRVNLAIPNHQDITEYFSIFEKIKCICSGENWSIYQGFGEKSCFIMHTK